MIKRNVFYYSISALSLFIVIYFETKYIGGIKVSHLWNGGLLLYLLFVIFKERINLYIYRPLILLAILQLFNADLIYFPFTALLNFSIHLLIPIVGIFFLKLNKNQLKTCIIFFATFFILSFIPDYFEMVPRLNDGYDLSSFGGTAGLIGVFQNPHGASIALSSSSIVMVYLIFSQKQYRSFFVLMLILGILFLIKTYVRTGIVMFVFGSIPILTYFLKRDKNSLVKVISFLIIGLSITFGIVKSNKVFINRMKGESKYGTENSLTNIGSGRGRIYIAGFQVFQELNLIEKIIGIGEEEQKIRMGKKIRLKIGAHNAFIDLLIKNGTLGLLLFLFYVYNIIKIIKYCPNNKIKSLSKSLFIAFIIMSLVQGFIWIYLNLFLLMTLSLLSKIEEPNTYGIYSNSVLLSKET